jgi:hypothetical protein
VAYPDWPVPQRLAGTDQLFAATEHDGNP